MNERSRRLDMRNIACNQAILLLLWALYVAPSVLYAQTAVAGSPAPFVPVSGSSIDSVNLETGGLQVAIPLWSIKQRGNLALSFTLRYQSQGASITQSCAEYSAQGACVLDDLHAVRNVAATVSVQDNITLSLTPVNDVITSEGETGQTETSIAGYYWQLTTPDGSAHKLASTGSGNFRSTDGTGWLYNENSFVLISQDGVRYIFMCSSTPCPANTVPHEAPYPEVQLSHVEDANGNQIYLNYASTSTNGVTYYNPSATSYTDTFGRTIPYPGNIFSGGPGLGLQSTSDASGCTGTLSASAYTWSVPGYDGDVSFTFCFATLPIVTNFFTENPQYQVGHYQEENSSAVVLQSVVLPDASTWTFSYSNPNSPTVNFGDLTQITLPTGGTISYGWNPTHAAPQLCSIDNNPSVEPLNFPLYFIDQVTSRTLNSGQPGSTGTWTYSIGPETVTSSSRTILTTVKDPTGAYVLHAITGLGDSCSYYDTQEQAYSASGSLLKTEIHQYRYQPDFDVPANLAWANGAPPYMMNVMPSYDTVIWANGATKQTAYQYNYTFVGSGINQLSPTTATIPYGMISTETHYDYGSGSPGTALAQRSITYYGFSNSAALANNLIALPSSITDTDEVTGQTSTTTYGYDETSLVSGTATANGGSAKSGWNSTPLAGAVRGNQTSVQQYWDTNSTYLTTTKTYYNTGMVASIAEPPNSAISGSLTTHYGYSSAYDGAYVTSVTDPQGNTSTFIYDQSSGLLSGSTDPNNVASTYSYYANLKLESAQKQGGDHNLATSVSYEYPNPNETRKTTVLNDTTSEVDTTIYDGLGRVIQMGHADPAGDDLIDTTYDPVGRKYTVSTPYRSKADASFYGLTMYAYDALSRIQTVTNPDSTRAEYSYSGATTEYSNESNGSTSSTKLSRVDGLGRLTYVCELVTSATPVQAGGDTPSACNLEIAGTGFLTAYTQTLRGVTQITQGAQTRTFAYDSLNRLTDSTNPESGHIHYVYDPDGNVASKTAGAPNSPAGGSSSVTTTYNYNNIHQVLSKVYSGTGASATPSVAYSYGQATVNGITLEYPVERLTSESTALGGTIQTMSVYSYDTDGRVASHYQCVTTMCPGTFEDVEYHYDGAGNAITVSTPQVGYTNTFDGAGHLTAVTPSWDPSAEFPATLMNANYAPSGEWSSATLGNGTTEMYTYTPRWLTGMQVKNQTGSVYSYIVSPAPDSQITHAVDSVNGTWNYTFDDFNRLLTAEQVDANNDVINGLSWSYDRYGNRWSQNNIAGSVTTDTSSFNTATNRAAVGMVYDAAGNVMSDSVHTYTYDAENRIATVNGTVSYIYDAEGRRVGKSTGNNAVTSPATGSSGIITVSGAETRHYFLSATGTYAGGCLAVDHGTASATIRNNSSTNPFSYTATVNWGQGDTAKTVALKLASAINSAAGSVITATPEAAMPSNIDVLSTGAGASTDYDLLVSVADAEATAYPWFIGNASFGLQATDMSGGEAANSGSGAITGTVYVVSLSGEVMDEIDNGTWVRSEIYAAGHHVATANASGVVFIHTDWLGTERARTNMSGVLCQTTTNEPFGDGVGTSGTCTAATPNLFTGKPRDTESGLDDFGARYLSSQWGHWMSPDWSAAPSGVPYAAFTNPQSLNLYAYVGNDPIDGQDADGHSLGSLAAMSSGLAAESNAMASDGERMDLLAAEDGFVNASANTTDVSWVGGTDGAAASNQTSQTTPASSTEAQQQNGQPTVQGVAASGTYGSKKAAAMAAEKAGLGDTKAAAKGGKYEEWGGWVISKGGKYTYTNPVTFGDPQHFYADNVTVPDGYSAVAGYHTHPDPQAFIGDAFSPQDAAWSNGHNIPLYLGAAANGNVRVYNPGMPYDRWLGTPGTLIGNIP